MKKIFALGLVAFSIFSVHALTATVQSVKGKVEIQEAGVWVKLQKGDSLEKGTVISTGFNSEAVLAVSNSNISLGPLTRVTLEDLVSTNDKDTTQIYIDSGTIAANVSGKDGKRAGFKVRSPVATASVRGTSFVVSSSGKLTVTEGLVAFGPSESEVASVVEDAPAEQAQVEKKGAVESTPSAETATSESGDQGHANAFASTADVGGEGVPVAAGQTSKASSSNGGSPSSPRAEMAKTAVGGVDNTVSVSALSSVASGSVSSGSVPGAVVGLAGSNVAMGSISVIVKFTE